MNGDDPLEPYCGGLSRWLIRASAHAGPIHFKARPMPIGASASSRLVPMWPRPQGGQRQCKARANSRPVPTQGHFQLTASAPRGSAFGLTEIQALELCDVRNAEPDKNGIVGHAKCNSYFQPRQVPTQGQCQLANRRLLTTAIANQGECQIKQVQLTTANAIDATRVNQDDRNLWAPPNIIILQHCHTPYLT